MRIAYNPLTAAALTNAPANNDITFDLKGLNIFVRGVKFKGTDTTYSVFKKHTSSSGGGYNGLVPVPSYTSTNTRFLREDGNWVTPTNQYTYSSLNNTDLNTLKTEGKWYYVAGGSTNTNGPDKFNDGSELYVGRNASGYRYQKVITIAGIIWFRIYDNNSWSSWKRWYTDANTDNKVLLSNVTTSNFRSVILGYNNSTNPSDLSSSITNLVYTTTKIYAQPSTGNLWAGKIYSETFPVLTEYKMFYNLYYLNIVILLWKDNEINNHRISGKIYTSMAGFSRYQACDIDLWFSRWSSTNYDYKFRMDTYGLGTQFSLVTCTYNGEKWWALLHTSILAVTFYFIGTYNNISWNKIVYYTTNTSTINNSEINNSIENKGNLLTTPYVNGIKYALITDNVSSSTKVKVTLNITNNSNYPIIWTNQNNENSINSDLFKSWNHLYYNPLTKKLTSIGGINAGNSQFTTGTGDIYLEWWRGQYASWKILNSSGVFKFLSNYTSSAGSYYDAFTLTYNSGNAWIKGNLAINGASLNINNGTIIISSLEDYRKIQSYGNKPLAINPEGNNVGIRITNPSYTLHVNGTLGVVGKLYTTLAGSTRNLLIVPGGEYTATTSPVTGYLKITLPTSWNSTMMRFDVFIYNYVTHESCQYSIGGYNYSGEGGKWVNTSAYSNRYQLLSRGNLTVRFGHDGSKCCIYIGESTTSWSYPQVVIRNVFLGYGGGTSSVWNNSWNISFTTTLATNIDNTITNTATNYFSNISELSNYLYVHDIRDTNPTPNDYDDKKIKAWFNKTGTPNSDWWSGITVKGWSDGYAVWQLAGYSSTASTESHLYYRRGINTSWGSWRTIVDSFNYTSIVLLIGTKTIGSPINPIYLNKGVPTLSSDTVGSNINPIYLNSGIITKSTYSFGNASGNIPINNDILNIDLDADKLDGVHNGYVTAKYFNYTMGSNWDCNHPEYTLYSEYGSSNRLILNYPEGWHYGLLFTIGRYSTLSNPLSALFMWDVLHNTKNSGILWFRTCDSVNGFNKNWSRVAFTSDITEKVNNLYWANVKVSASSSTTTSPTFATATMTRGVVGGYNNTSYALSTKSFICDSWVRTNGAAGWYSQTYGGGIYMTDSTYVRTYNSKKFYAIGGYHTPYTGSSWISLATRNNIISADANQTTSNAHGLYRVKNSNGDAIVFGGLGKNVGFYGFSAENISSGTNSVRWSSYWDVSTGDFYSSHTITSTGFKKSDSSDNYVLLGGGGHKSLSSFISSSDLDGYVTIDTPLSITGIKTFTKLLKFTVALGTSPFTVTSTTKVANLNSDMLDGYHIEDIFENGYVLTKTTINASSLSTSTYYPVTFSIGSSSNVRIECIVALDSRTKPSWSTHSLGFSVRKIWEVNGDGWGVNEVNRRILVSDYRFADKDPVRGIGLLTNSSTEYVYVRGGGKYHFYTSHNIVPVLRTSSYTVSSLTVSPTTSTPSEILEDYNNLLLTKYNCYYGIIKLRYNGASYLKDANYGNHNFLGSITYLIGLTFRFKVNFPPGFNFYNTFIIFRTDLNIKECSYREYSTTEFEVTASDASKPYIYIQFICLPFTSNF